MGRSDSSMHGVIRSSGFQKLISKKDRAKAFVYFIDEGTYIKIGKAKSVSRRLETLQISTPHELELLFAIPAVDEESAYYMESILHDDFYSCRERGEWFRITRKDLHGHFDLESYIRDLYKVPEEVEFIYDAV